MATTVKLSRPLKVEGKELLELVLDLDKLTGVDVDSCLIEAASAAGMPVLIKQADTGFHAQMAALACGMPVELLRSLSARDYIRVTEAVQGFLAASD